MGLSGRRGEAARAGPRAPPPSPNRTRREGGGALSFSLSLFSHLANPIPTRIGGEVLLPEGVGLLLARPMMSGRPPPLEPLYTEAGAPLETQVDPRDHTLSRVRCPLPP